MKLLKILRTQNIDIENNSTQSFQWVSINKLKVQDFYFEMDQQAWKHVKNKI